MYDQLTIQCRPICTYVGVTLKFMYRMRTAYQEHMSRQRRLKERELPRTPRCHQNTNSSAIPSKFGKCASIGTGYCHTHTRTATPSSAFEFVFRWHASYTLLRCLRQLICSCAYIPTQHTNTVLLKCDIMGRPALVY